jgi:lipoprotein-anchoring transpeptidase ErfK/SrfK
MPEAGLSRRDFLKLSGLSLASLALDRLSPLTKPFPPEEFSTPQVPDMKARVTTRMINVYQEPNFKSKRIRSFKRDRVVNIVQEITSPHGPGYNPHWYQLDEGYVHSGYLQRVDDAHLNPPLPQVPEKQLGEITVPMTQSMRLNRKQSWVPLYRLYYQSVHWITGLEEGEDGNPWYQLTDDLLRVKYYIPAAHMRPILDQELTSISPDVPPGEKRIEVSIKRQTLTAYERDQVVLHTKISSGLHSTTQPANGIPTDTPEGAFHVEVKVPSRHMGDGELTDDPEAYELPGVPWVSFFHELGVGFHGTYWHDNFGVKMSHGCVNMRTTEAQWLFRWSQPDPKPRDWFTRAHGTLVKIQ